MSSEDQTYLPPPDGLLDPVDFRVQEMIYGHRFNSDQLPYMIVLEALSVCAEVPLGTKPVKDNTHEKIDYESKQRRKMRFLLFLDYNLDQVANDSSLSDVAKWEKWQKLASNLYDQVNGNKNPEHEDHFRYLETKFKSSIRDLAEAVKILKSQELDISNNRRWTSKFLSIKGTDMICDDLSDKGKWQRDRRFFSRGGELVYLMLNRSGHATTLREKIGLCFFDDENPINSIATAVSEIDESPKGKTSIGYLPLAEHDTYENMAKDWCSILSISGMPRSRMFEPLFLLTGLNLFIYFSRRSQETIGERKSVPILADLGHGVDGRLQESSRQYWNHHRAISNRAVDAYIRGVAEKHDWKKVVKQNNPQAARDFIKRHFGDKDKNGTSDVDYEEMSPAQQLDDLINRVKTRSNNNIYRLLVPLAKGIGLVPDSTRSEMWFSLSDDMITALVLANVERTKSVELRNFVSILYDRYGIVIGPDEVEGENRRLPVGKDSLRENLVAFESRLSRLFLTRRLSDDCAFVVNPYGEKHAL